MHFPQRNPVPPLSTCRFVSTFLSRLSSFSGETFSSSLSLSLEQLVTRVLSHVEIYFSFISAVFNYSFYPPVKYFNLVKFKY